MDTNTDAAQPGGAPSDIVQIPAAGSEPLSPREAARALAGFRVKQREAGEARAPEGEAPRLPEAPPPAADAPETQAPAESGAAEEAASEGAEPPLEPPSSWSQAARERWANLDRETQDFLRQREGESEAARLKVENEAAAERAAIETERRSLGEARSHYESALPNLLAALHQEQARDFSDIKSLPDVEKLAREDWPRYVLWDAQQKRIAAVEAELKGASERQEREHTLSHAARVQRELDLFIEKAPEIADPAARSRLQDAALGMLHELGFSDGELKQMWSGHKDISLHDHRLHLIIRDGLRYRDAQKAAREAAAKPVPPVQRPGVGQAKGAAHDALVQNLARRLDQTGKVKDAAKLLVERRRAR
jgi:hypothetical protein